MPSTAFTAVAVMMLTALSQEKNTGEARLKNAMSKRSTAKATAFCNAAIEKTLVFSGLAGFAVIALILCLPSGGVGLALGGQVHD